MMKKTWESSSLESLKRIPHQHEEISLISLIFLLFCFSVSFSSSGVESSSPATTSDREIKEIWPVLLLSETRWLISLVDVTQMPVVLFSHAFLVLPKVTLNLFASFFCVNWIVCQVYNCLWRWKTNKPLDSIEMREAVGSLFFFSPVWEENKQTFSNINVLWVVWYLC